jgi:hypothetical protein
MKLWDKLPLSMRQAFSVEVEGALESFETKEDLEDAVSEMHALQATPNMLVSSTESDQAAKIPEELLAARNAVDQASLAAHSKRTRDAYSGQWNLFKDWLLFRFPHAEYIFEDPDENAPLLIALWIYEKCDLDVSVPEVAAAEQSFVKNERRPTHSDHP